MAWAWGLEWVWVGGYSAAATTILLTNCMLLVSVIRNRYLHYTFNYVVFALSLRCPLYRCGVLTWPASSVGTSSAWCSPWAWWWWPS